MTQPMRTCKSIKIDERAQVGIGTMIVFIATVLVSAVAAGVLIDMSGKLQQKSSKTGSDATEEISSNLFIESIVGERSSSTATGLNNMTLYVSLAPGASELDLGNLEVQISNGTKLTNFDHVDGAPDADSFNVTEVRDSDNSFTSANPTMTSGDLVKVLVDLSSSASNMPFAVRDDVQVTLIPETGTKVASGFSTPSSWGIKTVVHLY